MKEEYSSYKFSEDFHMLSSRKKLLYDITEMILSFLCFYPLLACVIYTAHFKNDDVLDGVLLLIPLLIMAIVRKKTKNFILYIIYTLLVIGVGIILMWTEGLIVFHSIFLLSYGIYSVYKRVKGKNNFWRFNNLAVMNIFLALIYGFALLNKFVILQKLIFTFAILSLLIFIIYFHYSSGDKLLQWEEYTDEEHIKNLKIINVMVSIMIIIAIGIIIIIAWKLGIFARLDFIYNNFCILVFGAFKMATVSQTDFMDMKTNPMFSFEQDNGSISTMNTSTIMNLFIITMKLAFFAVILIDIIAIIFVIVQKLYNRHYRKLILGEVIESTITKEQLSEKLRTLRNPLNILKKAVFKTNKDKLRRIYYHNVMAYKKKGVEVEKWNTPEEIEDNVKAKYNVKLKEVTKFYEKFRYNVDEPTDEDLRAMKKLFKK